MNNCSLNDRILAVAAHGGGVLLGILPSVLIYLKTKNNRKARYVISQSREALNFQLSLLIILVVVEMFVITTYRMWFFVFVWTINIIFSVIATSEAVRGENYRYPFIFRVIT